jgi:hypothetical protein
MLLSPDFRAVFEAALGSSLLLSAEPSAFITLAVSDAYVRVTGIRREDVLGRSVCDIFAGNPGDPAESTARIVRESLGRALETRAPDRIQLSRYELYPLNADSGEIAIRYWNIVHTPILDADGHVQYVLHCVEEVTDKLRAQRRESFLLQIAEATRSLTDPDAIVQTAVRLLGEHLQVDRGVYCTFKSD